METNTSGNTPTSYLLIDAVAPSDSGKYSCHPANAQEISVNVQVQEGENSFAFDPKNSCKSKYLQDWFMWLFLDSSLRRCPFLSGVRFP